MPYIILVSRCVSQTQMSPVHRTVQVQIPGSALVTFLCRLQISSSACRSEFLIQNSRECLMRTSPLSRLLFTRIHLDTLEIKDGNEWSRLMFTRRLILFCKFIRYMNTFGPEKAKRNESCIHQLRYSYFPTADFTSCMHLL